MTSVNLVMLLGTIETAPRYGNGATTFRLQTNEKWSGEHSGQRTETHVIVAEGKLAQVAAGMGSGQLIHIEGSLRYVKNRPAQVIARHIEIM